MKRTYSKKMYVIAILSVCIIGCSKGCRNAADRSQVSERIDQRTTNREEDSTMESKETTGKEKVLENEGTTENGDLLDETKEVVEQNEQESIDVDLASLSSTMVYSEVYHMMTMPEDYIGKRVRMRGNFSVYEDTQTGKIYFACMVVDATACCTQGIEFELQGEQTYPDDYPSVDSEITVIGEFSTYEEDGATYCSLKNASFVE